VSHAAQLDGRRERSRSFAGAAVDNWIAPPLDNSNPSPAPWDKDELFAYLRTGVSRSHGTAAGPMAPVIHGLSKLPDADIEAIAIYFADVDGATKRPAMAYAAIRQLLAGDRLRTALQYDPAARLYTAACASCHYNGTDKINPLRPELTLNTALHLDDPTNLIQVILNGIDAKDGAVGIVMPTFRVPGMVYARPKLPPTRNGSKVVSVDDTSQRASVRSATCPPGWRPSRVCASSAPPAQLQSRSCGRRDDR
jgi:hypothetical protein